MILLKKVQIWDNINCLKIYEFSEHKYFDDDNNMNAYVTDKYHYYNNYVIYLTYVTSVPKPLVYHMSNDLKKGYKYYTEATQ